MTKKLGFGCMRLPLTNPDDQTSINMNEFQSMVDLFMEKGFTYFDTAYMYHDFTSETALREALVRRYPRTSYTLASKMPIMMVHTKEDQERIFAEQLEKCGVEYFDYYMIHNIGRIFYGLAEEIDSFGFLKAKKAEGKIKTIGISCHDNAEFLEKVLTEHPEIEFVQIQLNYLDWDNDGIQSRKCLEVCEKHGKPVIVMEPVKGGNLAAIPEAAADLFKAYAPEASIASWAVRFAATPERVMIVLSGMSNLAQMQDNLSYMEDFKPITPEENKIISEAVAIINKSVVIPCTNCQYCVHGCPEEIPIPQYFTLYNANKQITVPGFPTEINYYQNMVKTHAKASDCIECGECERVCPQHIAITTWLKDVAKTFEIPLF
ncbi:MAG: aldo/keto reductase [Methanocorpusculum sp.]|nr:aldo/keto reductase [Methanocorpusculum sp.]